MKEVFNSVKNLSLSAKIGCAVGLFFIFSAVITSTGLLIDRIEANKYARQAADTNAKVWAAKKKVDELTNAVNNLRKQNDILKIQNEARAEILKQNDARLSNDAKKINQILEERKKNVEKIANSADDLDYQRCELCFECERSGYKLSESYCRGCETAPQNSSGK